MEPNPTPQNIHHEPIGQSPKHQQLMDTGWSILKFIFAVAFLVTVINGFGLQSYEVFGDSMQPTLEPGDRLVISKIGKTFSSIGGNEYIPKRGEVVVFHDPRGSSDLQLIKRVVGLPGERVALNEGVITVYNDDNPDGFQPDELVDIDFEYTSGRIETVVPENNLFVVGDNRRPNGSLDSRNELGTVSSDDIVGVLVLRLFPLSRARLF